MRTGTATWASGSSTQPSSYSALNPTGLIPALLDPNASWKQLRLACDRHLAAQAAASEALGKDTEDSFLELELIDVKLEEPIDVSCKNFLEEPMVGSN